MSLFPILNHVPGAMRPWVWSGLPATQETYNLETGEMEMQPQWGVRVFPSKEQAIRYAKGMKWISEDWKA